MIWVAVGVLTFCVLICLVLLAVLVRRIGDLTQRLAQAEDRLVEFGPLLADTRSALRKAESRTMRADDLVSTATSLTNRADAASKFAYSVATNPIVRVLAFSRGVQRGLKSLFGKA